MTKVLFLKNLLYIKLVQKNITFFYFSFVFYLQLHSFVEEMKINRFYHSLRELSIDFRTFQIKIVKGTVDVIVKWLS